MVHRGAITAGALALSAVVLAACTGDTDRPGLQPASPTPAESPGAPATPTSPEGTQRQPRVIGTIASGLAVPWGIDFLPDGSAVVTERDSRRVLRINPNTGGEASIAELGVIEEAAPEGEAGLLGVAVSPEFDLDRTIYLYLTTSQDNRVVSTTITADRIGELEVVLDGIPKGFVHDGGRLEFGPDGYLYVSTGETGDDSLAQLEDSLAGKILRIDTEGNPAPDNPDPDSPVFTLGHRNVQGLAFDDGDRLWASEFGSQSFDELNLIEAGNNYGWPMVEGAGGESGLTDPQITWATSEASPSGLAWADGHLWLGALAGERLWRVTVTDGHASNPTAYFVGEFGRLRTVVTDPDGNLWVSTSNRDGRGSPATEDDRILLVDLPSLG